jgi:hypothetical protein
MACGKLPFKRAAWPVSSQLAALSEEAEAGRERDESNRQASKTDGIRYGEEDFCKAITISPVFQDGIYYQRLQQYLNAKSYHLVHMVFYG